MRKLVVLAALMAASACQAADKPTEPLVEDLTGSYSLQTLNETPLPFTVVSHDTSFSVDTDTLKLGADGSWDEIVRYRQTVGSSASTNESIGFSGFWIRSHNDLTFRTVQGATFYLGSATTTTLNLTDGSATYLFQR
jgi:hypothetical protein